MYSADPLKWTKFTGTMLFQLVENISITNIVSVEFHMDRKGDQSVFAF